MCATGKVRHATKEAAYCAAKRIGNCQLNVYRCGSCNGWHLGNSRSHFRVQKRIDQILSNHARQLERRLAQQ